LAAESAGATGAPDITLPPVTTARYGGREAPAAVPPAVAGERGAAGARREDGTWEVDGTRRPGRGAAAPWAAREPVRGAFGARVEPSDGARPGAGGAGREAVA
jgi:hypothetical protein